MTKDLFKDVPVTSNHLDNARLYIDSVLADLIEQKIALSAELMKLEEKISRLHQAQEELRLHLVPKRLSMQQMVEESVWAGVQRSQPGADPEEKLRKALEYAVALAKKVGFPHTDPEFWNPHLQNKLAELHAGSVPIEDPGFPFTGRKPTPED